MKTLKSTAFIAYILLIAFIGNSSHAAQPKAVAEIDNQGGLALRGYDAVAYFTDGKATKGDAGISYQWHGVTYRFASQAHREAFMTQPEHYAPQYGGYCALAVSENGTADGDPEQWAIVDGKLYLNYNGLAKSLWDKDRSGKIHAADGNWPKIPKTGN